MSGRLLASVALAAVLLAGAPAAGHFQCYTESTVKAWLRAESGQVPIYMGKAAALGGNKHVELWQSFEDRTWTLIGVTRDGRACLLAQGTHWAPIMLPDLESKDPT